jgi:hypothetical protein
MRISHWSKVDTRWYLGVLAGNAKRQFYLLSTRATGEVRPSPAGKLLLTCPPAECRHQADYSAATVSRFQKESSALKEKGATVEDSQNGR